MRYLTPGYVPHTCSALCHPTSPNRPRVPTATANRFHFCNTTAPLQTSHVHMPNNSRGCADDAKYCVRLIAPPVWRGAGDVQICRRPIPTGETPVMASDHDRCPVAWGWRQV